MSNPQVIHRYSYTFSPPALPSVKAGVRSRAIHRTSSRLPRQHSIHRAHAGATILLGDLRQRLEPRDGHHRTHLLVGLSNRPLHDSHVPIPVALGHLCQGSKDLDQNPNCSDVTVLRSATNALMLLLSQKRRDHVHPGAELPAVLGGLPPHSSPGGEDPGSGTTPSSPCPSSPSSSGPAAGPRATAAAGRPDSPPSPSASPPGPFP